MTQNKSGSYQINSNYEDRLTVQKSIPLFSLWRSDLTLAEFKILDLYLSRIDSRKPENRVVQIEKGELEKILGVSKIENRYLEKRLKHLMGNVVKIEDQEEKGGFKLISLFEEAIAEQDENGIWTVKMECTQKAMKYIFNIEDLGYLKYKLRCITAITSRYTYVLFLYLEANRYKNSWTVSLEDLKKILNCEGEETYKEYKHFNNLVLKKIQKELSKTDCQFTYTAVRAGRKVAGIQFKLKPLKNTIPEMQAGCEPDNEETKEWKENKKVPEPDDMIGLYEDAAPGLNRAELEAVVAVLVTVPEHLLPHISDGGIELWRYHYLNSKYKLMKLYDQKNPIKNQCAYLVSMIQKDIKQSRCKDVG